MGLLGRLSPGNVLVVTRGTATPEPPAGQLCRRGRGPGGLEPGAGVFQVPAAGGRRAFPSGLTLQGPPANTMQ